MNGDRKATKDSHMRKLLLPPLGLGREREEMVFPEVGAVQQRLPNGNGSQRGWSYTGNNERQQREGRNTLGVPLLPTCWHPC